MWGTKRNRAKDSAYTNKYTMLMSTHLQDISNFSTDGSPCIFISGKKSSLGEITNCNMALCKTFGYTKKDLVGRNIKSLMPKMLSEHHDKFLQRNLDRIKISCCSVTSRDIPSFGLHKAKYIFPVAIRLLSTPNLLNEMQYIAKIKVDKKHTSNSVAFLLLNRRKEVTDVTSSCVQMLNISHSTLANFSIDMTVLAPGLTKKDVLQNCMQKTGSRITVYHPSAEHRQKADEAVFKDEVEKLAAGEVATEYQCRLIELSYEPVGKIGYLMMLETIPEAIIDTTILSKNAKAPTFQFTYSEELNIFVRELREDDNSGYNNQNSSSLSQILSIYSHESAGFNKGAVTQRRDLSDIPANKFKQLSFCVGMSAGLGNGKKKGKYQPDDTKSLYASHFQRKMPRPDLLDAASPAQLERKNSFISVFSEHTPKQKSKHSSYYEVLLPKYKQLSKFVSDDTGAKNLIRLIEDQVMYGEGVKTYRLLDGDYIEVIEENYSQLLAKEIDTPQFVVGEGRRNIEKRKEEEYKLWRNRLRTKNDLRRLINETPYPLSVNIIKPFTIVCIGILSVLLIAEYVYTRYRLQDILTATDTLGESYSLKHVLLNLWYDTREIFMVSSGAYTVFAQSFSSATDYLDLLRSRVDANAYEANRLVEALSGTQFSFVSSETDYMRSPSISMYLYTNASTPRFIVANYTVYQALLIDIEAFAKTGKLSPSEFRTGQWLLNTGVDSLYTSLIAGLQRLFAIFLSLLARLSVTSDAVDYVILSMSAFDLFVCLAVGWVLTRFIGRYHDKTMHVFLELPRKYMIELNAQCESFVNELQNADARNGNELEDGDEDDAQAAAEMGEMISLNNSRGGYERIYTHKKTIGLKYIVSYVVLMVLAQGYFVLQFMLRSQFYENLNGFATIYYKAYEEMIGFLEAIDVYREYYQDPDTEIGQRSPLKASVYTQWERLYLAQKESRDYDPTGSSLLGEGSKNGILELLNGDLCQHQQYLKKMKSPSQCPTIANKTASLVSFFPFFTETENKEKTKTEGIEQRQDICDKRAERDDLSIQAKCGELLEQQSAVGDKADQRRTNSSYQCRHLGNSQRQLDLLIQCPALEQDNIPGGLHVWTQHNILRAVLPVLERNERVCGGQQRNAQHYSGRWAHQVQRV